MNKCLMTIKTMVINNKIWSLHKVWIQNDVLRQTAVFQHNEKSCVKEQWPKKLLFQKFWHTVMICNLRPKKGGIYLSSWNHDRLLSQQRTTKLNMYSVFGEQMKSLSSKQSKLNFWNRLHPTFAFLCRLLTQTAT